MPPELKELTAAYLACLFEHGFEAAVVLAFPDRARRCTIANFRKDGVVALLRAEADSLSADSRFGHTILVEVDIGNDVGDPNVS